MPSFACDICGIHVNSQDQLAVHRSGQKHLKKLKALGLEHTSVNTGANATPNASNLMYGKFVAASEDSKKTPVTPLSAVPSASSETQNASTTETKPVQVTPTSTAVKKTQNIPGLPNIPGMNPVQKAVIGNALGKLPTKRKPYDGFCEYCNVEYTSESHQYQHLSGQKHAKKKRLIDATKTHEECLSMPMGFSGFTCQYCNVLLNTMEQYEFHRQGQKHKKNIALLKKMGRPTEEGVVTVISTSTS